MAFADLDSLGATGSSGNNQATLVLTTTAIAAVDEIVVVVIAVDNRLGTADNNDVNVSGVTDSGGNTWIAAHTWSNNQALAQAGATVAMWYTVVTTQIASGGTITATFASATTSDASGLTARHFSKAAGSVVSLEGITASADDGVDPNELVFATTPNIECIRIRGIAGEVGNNTSLTPTSGWTAWANGNSATTGTTAEMCARAEHIIYTGTDVTSNPTWVACDIASVGVAFKEVEAARRQLPVNRSIAAQRAALN